MVEEEIVLLEIIFGFVSFGCNNLNKSNDRSDTGNENHILHQSFF